MSSTKPPQTPVTPCFPDQQDDMSWSTTATLATADSDSLPPSSSSQRSPTPTPKKQMPPPPKKTRTLKKRSMMLRRRFAGVSRPLAPLLSIETGLAHPRFPPTLLHYHLLTDAELEELARFYHQNEPSRFSMEYPMPVVTRWRTPPAGAGHCAAAADEDDGMDMDVDVDVGVDAETAEVKQLRAILQLPLEEADLESYRRLQDKRRRFGRFMGLQGMESATEEEGEVSMREEMERWVNGEIARREARQAELEAWRSKGYW